MTPVPGGRAFGGTIQNALPRGVGRFRMCSAALCTYSAERLFLFRVCRGLRAAPNAFSREGSWREAAFAAPASCGSAALRGRGLALSVTAHAVPHSPFCRCATSSPGRGKSFLKGRGLGIAGKLPSELQSLRFRQRLSLWESCHRR